MYDVKSLKAEEFISDEEIKETLAYADANKENWELIDEIIEKAKLRKGLSHREASVLLACENPEKIEKMSQSEFSAIFRHSPVKRAKLAGLKRNAANLKRNEKQSDRE